MGILSFSLARFIDKLTVKKNRISDYIYYKIIESEGHHYILQCINTKSVFSASILDIVFDRDLLYNLHPIQACYIGIEYSSFLKSNNISSNDLLKKKFKTLLRLSGMADIN